MIINKITRSGQSALNEQEIKDFPRLYRLVCEDLAEAKLLHLSYDVIEYLNNIIGLAHTILYKLPPLKKSAFKEFFTTKLPGILLKYRGYILLSALLFLGTYAVFYYLVKQDTGIAAAILQEDLLQNMEESYKQGITVARDSSFKSFAVSFYIHNNVSIAFACFASGVLFGLGSIYFLVYNGIVLGTISGYIVGKGHGKNFYNFVTAHSVFELSGIVIAGAAGLLLGYSIIRATRYYRLEWLGKMKEDIFTMVAAGAILIFFAAFIEGFISPSFLPYSIKLSIAVICSAVIATYFILIPVARRLIKK